MVEHQSESLEKSKSDLLSSKRKASTCDAASSSHESKQQQYSTMNILMQCQQLNSILSAPTELFLSNHCANDAERTEVQSLLTTTTEQQLKSLAQYFFGLLRHQVEATSSAIISPLFSSRLKCRVGDESLFVDTADMETIWGQIELQNTVLIDEYYKKHVRKLIRRCDNTTNTGDGSDGNNGNGSKAVVRLVDLQDSMSASSSSTAEEDDNDEEEQEEHKRNGGDDTNSLTEQEKKKGKKIKDIGSSLTEEKDEEEAQSQLRMHERMERTMTEMMENEDGDEEADKHTTSDDDSSSSCCSTSTTGTSSISLQDHDTTEEGDGNSGIKKMRASSNTISAATTKYGDSEEGKGQDSVDPAAEELNDGFFDLNEMEEFADEEEDYHTLLGERDGEEEDQVQLSYGDKDEMDSLPADSHSNISAEEESKQNSLFGKKKAKKNVTKTKPTNKKQSFQKRKKYRTDEDIAALEALYSTRNEPESLINNEEVEDDVLNMTAADFFGQPSKKYMKKYMHQRRKQEFDGASDYCLDKLPREYEEMDDKKKTNRKDLFGNYEHTEELNMVSNKEEGDTWTEHDFGDDNEGVDEDWRNDGESSEDFAKTDSVAHHGDSKDKWTDAITHIAKNPPDLKSQLSTTYSKQKEKLGRQIIQLEQDTLAEKPWAMMGEVQGTSRPVNSLLDATPDFETANKVAPTITAEHTISIEDMIKRRIIDEDYDDVIPRELPDIAASMVKKKQSISGLAEVSQEKSKLGLGELYEREFLKKAEGYDKDACERETEEDKVKGEMRSLFANLCSKLDALSNYHFAPRPIDANAEIKSVATPAIAIEEILPLHVSDARAVAPEEIYGLKRGRDGLLIGDSEIDQSGKRRRRQAKKTARRKARREKSADERIVSRLQPKGVGLSNPYEKRRLKEELSQARSTGRVASGTLDTNDTSQYTTSSQFFKKLQDEVQESASEGNQSRRKRRDLDDREKGNRKKSSAFVL